MFVLASPSGRGLPSAFVLSRIAVRGAEERIDFETTVRRRDSLAFGQSLGYKKGTAGAPVPLVSAPQGVSRPCARDRSRVDYGATSMTHIAFDTWFSRLTGSRCTPHEWQRVLSAEGEPRSRLIRIPTGMGKTLGVVAAWSWHRLYRGDDRWPRRLVWCLPMRVLVEQTEAVVRGALRHVGLLWDGSSDHTSKVGVHLLMGGTDPGGDWNLFPEETAVLIGTQDMLLSRALNRGYASGRARWPLEFGLLSHDALWVMDEVQIMDV